MSEHSAVVSPDEAFAVFLMRVGATRGDPLGCVDLSAAAGEEAEQRENHDDDDDPDDDAEDAPPLGTHFSAQLFRRLNPMRSREHGHAPVWEVAPP